MGAYRFWVRLFALAFILSFAASMPVLIQFGSVWPGLMEQVGDVIGPMLAASMLSLLTPELQERVRRDTLITAYEAGAIIEARGLSSAASAANAAIDHVRDWVLVSGHRFC
ncbi:transmembrane cytochrome oxidase [Alcaligenes faecalis subsp. faecalis NCIB 8687]|nr:transmembrane cytochrome oxidase [Alcaligenes faecalis subsp. faecalis NCIB 8687]